MGTRQGFRRVKVLTLELERSGGPFLRTRELQWASLFLEKRPSPGGQSLQRGIEVSSGAGGEAAQQGRGPTSGLLPL